MNLRYFDPSEFDCKGIHEIPCGFTYEKVSLAFMEKLDEWRHRVGEPAILNCSARCIVHNAKVGGAENSRHTIPAGESRLVDAADVHKSPRLAAKERLCVQTALDLDLTIAIYRTFFHIDDHDRGHRFYEFVKGQWERRTIEAYFGA